MRKILKTFFVFMIFVFMASCQIQDRTIEKINTGDMKLIQIYPNKNINGSIAFPGINKSSINTKHNKDIDFANGIVYDENSILGDGVIHTLDLSSLLNNKPGQIFLYCEWLDGAEDEQFQCFFKPAGLNVSYESVNVGKNVSIKLLNMITNENSQIEWYHNYNMPFDGRNPYCDPDYYDWNAISFRIMIYYYDTSGEINN